MSDDEADLELLELLRQHFGLGGNSADSPPDTKVLKSAEFIVDNSIDVALDMRGTQSAAIRIMEKMKEREFDIKEWSRHELHPKSKDEATVNFIFTMDLLNFSFWSEKAPKERFSVDYKGKRWTGYWSLVAALQRALDEGIPITTPSFWHFEDECTDEMLRNVFRSATAEEMPLLDQRIACLREAAEVLCKEFDLSVLNLISRANHSAAGLTNLLAEHFQCFRDEGRFEGKTVRFLKRAQIFVADLWAAFEGENHGQFDDIEKITMFADYRIPQMLYTLGVLQYSPPLEHRVRKLQPIEPGHSWELQIRGCTIWGIELIKREIRKRDPSLKVNAILIDFFLYDLISSLESNGDELIPHHRTRSMWY